MEAALRLEPVPGAPPGFQGRLVRASGPEQALDPAFGAALAAAWKGGAGLLLVRGLGDLEPEAFVDLSRHFGEVERMDRTRMNPRSLQMGMPPEVMTVSNHNPMHSELGDSDDPAAITVPERRGWHTDQSFRRPPPDGTLFYCKGPPPPEGGDTLFADGTLAFARLESADQAVARAATGLHANDSCGKTWDHARGDPLADAKNPVRPDIAEVESLFTAVPQPLVRIHPTTQRPALYLCEKGQMDWISGPVLGMPPGADGEGGELVMRLNAHATSPDFVYRHVWQEFDLVAWDNRCFMHCATAWDVERYPRLHWRTTVQGEPGPEYAGDARL